MPPKKKPTSKNDRKVPAKLQSYSIRLKTLAIAWKREDKMTTSQIKKKTKELYQRDVPDSTLATWWCPKNLLVVDSLPPDRLDVDDRRINPSQRPDVLVDMEKILKRKVIGIKLTGIPYTREVIQLLAIQIFQKLISFDLYNVKGKRKDPTQVLDERIINSVQHNFIPNIWHRVQERQSFTSQLMFNAMSQKSTFHVSCAKDNSNVMST